MSLKSKVEFVNRVKKIVHFLPLQTKTRTEIVKEIKRLVTFPYDENYNFSYWLCENGDFFLQENGSKIIRQ